MTPDPKDYATREEWFAALNAGEPVSADTPLSEWIRSKCAIEVQASDLDAWSEAAAELERAQSTAFLMTGAHPDAAVKPSARSAGAKKAWEKIRARKLEGPPPAKATPIKLNVEQREVIDQAIARVRESEGDPLMTEGRCIELICGDFLAGV